MYSFGGHPKKWHLYEEYRMAKKKNISKREQRNLRTQQIVFYAIGIIIILSMVISLVAK
jgi:predicted nucleic acid-binding Zn ribbon protein